MYNLNKNTTPQLLIENLSIRTPSRVLVNDLSLAIYPGETVALVGESGSGKTLTAQAIVQLFASPTISICGGAIFFEGKNLLECRPQEMQALRGSDLAFIPQNPLSSLNPTLTIGFQLMEAMKARISRQKKRELVLEMLQLVGFSAPREQIKAYPHELSGGMRQRVLIAMALINKPKLVIADEPTTALDMTVQAQILDLLCDLKKRCNLSLLFITHDLGIVAQIASRVVVMHAGCVVEAQDVDGFFYSPQHAYTQELIHSVPDWVLT